MKKEGHCILLVWRALCQHSQIGVDEARVKRSDVPAQVREFLVDTLKRHFDLCVKSVGEEEKSLRSEA